MPPSRIIGTTGTADEQLEPCADASLDPQPQPTRATIERPDLDLSLSLPPVRSLRFPQVGASATRSVLGVGVVW